MNTLHLHIVTVSELPASTRGRVCSKWAELHNALGKMEIGQTIRVLLSKADSLSAKSAMYGKAATGMRFITVRELSTGGNWYLYIKRVK